MDASSNAKLLLIGLLLSFSDTFDILISICIADERQFVRVIGVYWCNLTRTKLFSFDVGPEGYNINNLYMASRKWRRSDVTQADLKSTRPTLSKRLRRLKLNGVDSKCFLL